MASEPAAPATKSPGPLLVWLSSRPRSVLALAVVLLLGAFITKPFHIDDPLFLQAARQIQAHPANPYGFTVNWYGTESPMWDVMKNPPLACYYIRLSAAVLGWSEPALHIAFLLPAMVAILGTFQLARRLCRQPLLAAGITLATPVFLVSSTTLMCDVLMLAFWVWAAVLWLEGSDRKDAWRLGGAALLITLAALTKYFGIVLIPLLAAWSVIGRQPLKSWLGWFLVPLAALAAYQGWTHLLYGQPLLADASDYALAFQAPSGLLQRILTSLSFTGGCLAAAILLAPLLWRSRALALGLIGMLLIALVLGSGFLRMKQTAVPAGSCDAALAVQIALWSCGGICVLALAVLDIVTKRNADSWLLGLWVAGTFVFATFLNWTVSGRTLLPMTVPFGILAARRLEQRFAAKTSASHYASACVVLASAALAWLVAGADFALAQAARQSARTAAAGPVGVNHPLWFEGHWGFQHYMEAAGASALDQKESPVQPGDRIVLPRNNSNIRMPGGKEMTLLEKISVPGPEWIATMSKATGAGFYSSVWGPLPFSFGPVPPEGADVYVAGPSPPGSTKESPGK